MRDTTNSVTHCSSSTRRRLIVGSAFAFGGLITGSVDSGMATPQTAKDASRTTENQARTSLHQEIEFKAGPQRIYEILLDSKQFATFTGLTAEIDPKAGGAFKTFGGLIVGRNVELVPNERIVQAWRPTHWDPGIYSIVRFQLKPGGIGSILLLDHSSFPEGEFDSLNAGWKSRYWDPLARFLAS